MFVGLETEKKGAQNFTTSMGVWSTLHQLGCRYGTNAEILDDGRSIHVSVNDVVASANPGSNNLKKGGLLLFVVVVVVVLVVVVVVFQILSLCILTEIR